MTAKFNQARKDAFLAAVAEAGDQTLAVERAKVSRSWVHSHRSSDPEFNDGKVVNIVDFGAFVNLVGGKDGLVQVSEMRNGRVAKPTDVVSEGQTPACRPR